MKNIPIVILNKDRLIPLQDQVTALRKRGYWNIIVIDNKSTYQPLLDWYKVSGVDVYHNPTYRTCNGSFYFLAYEFGIEKFKRIIHEGQYVFNDSDVVPTEDCPHDFIEDLCEIQKRLNAHKVGVGLKIDDLPDFFYKKQQVIEAESVYWKEQVETEPIPLFNAAIDTTLAVYGQGRAPVWGGPTIVHQPGGWISGPCFRTGGKHIARHIPWYMDYNNLPEDERYYIMNLEANKGPVWSFRAKEVVK